MMSRYLLIKLLISGQMLFFALSKAQVYEKYPIGQNFYKGGIAGLNQDIKSVIKKNNLKPCERDGEEYRVSVLVNPGGKIQFVKDFDSITIEKNKCAYDLSRKILPHLNKWIPAKIEEKEVMAIASFTVNSGFLFNHKVYKPEKTIQPPIFQNGKESFMDLVKREIEREINLNATGRKINICFTIKHNGEMTNLRITNFQIDEIKQRKLLDRISSIKGKWTPATNKGIPMDYHFCYNFEQEFNFELERKKDVNRTINRDYY